GVYSIQVSQPTDDHPDALISDPKDGQTRDATTILLNSAGFGQAVGQIDTNLAGDRDLFQVQSTARGTMTVDVIAGTPLTLDSVVRVYDSYGSLVAMDDDSGD